MKSTYSYSFSCKTRPESKIASRHFPRQWPLILPKLQVLNRLSAASQPVFWPWKQVQLPPQAAPARQDLGPYLNKLTAPQPPGPMALDHLMTTGTPDADLILSRTQRMNIADVPYYFSFHVNTSTLVCLLCSRSSGQRPTYQLSTSLPEFIAKQAPFPAGLYLKQEPAKCQDFVARCKDDGVRSEVDSPICNTSTKILVRQSKSPEDREIGRRFAPLWEVLAPKRQEIFPERDVKGTFIVPALANPLTNAMRLSCNTFRRLRTTHVGKLT